MNFDEALEQYSDTWDEYYEEFSDDVSYGDWVLLYTGSNDVAGRVLFVFDEDALTGSVEETVAAWADEADEQFEVSTVEQVMEMIAKERAENGVSSDDFDDLGYRDF